MWGSALRDAAGWMGAAVTRDDVTRAEREMALVYFAGYLQGRRRFAPVALPAPAAGTGAIPPAQAGPRG
jgi:hypothetical protein